MAHFFATHAMHALPALGLAATWLPARVGTGAVWLGAAAYTAQVAFAFDQAVSGRPFLPGLL